MDRAQEVKNVYNSNLDKKTKINVLQDIVLDIKNEMEAQDQNMHPEVHHKMAEGMQLAQNYLRELQS